MSADLSCQLWAPEVFPRHAHRADRNSRMANGTQPFMAMNASKNLRISMAMMHILDKLRDTRPSKKEQPIFSVFMAILHMNGCTRCCGMRLGAKAGRTPIVNALVFLGCWHYQKKWGLWHDLNQAASGFYLKYRLGRVQRVSPEPGLLLVFLLHIPIQKTSSTLTYLLLHALPCYQLFCFLWSNQLRQSASRGPDSISQLNLLFC